MAAKWSDVCSAAKRNLVDDSTGTKSGARTISGINTFSAANIHTGDETHSGDEVFSGSPTGIVVSKTITFTENATNTIHTGTVVIPAGATLHDIIFTNVALWTATSASVIIGDADDDNGWLQATDIKATDLLVGEVFSISGWGVSDTASSAWHGKVGDYMVASTGRKGRVTSGVDSGTYYGAASEVIAKITVGTPATTVGRSFMTVTYSVGTVTAATVSGP